MTEDEELALALQASAAEADAAAASQPEPSAAPSPPTNGHVSASSQPQPEARPEPQQLHSLQQQQQQQPASQGGKGDLEQVCCFAAGSWWLRVCHGDAGLAICYLVINDLAAAMDQGTHGCLVFAFGPALKPLLASMLAVTIVTAVHVAQTTCDRAHSACFFKQLSDWPTFLPRTAACRSTAKIPNKAVQAFLSWHAGTLLYETSPIHLQPHVPSCLQDTLPEEPGPGDTDIYTVKVCNSQ